MSHFKISQLISGAALVLATAVTASGVSAQTAAPTEVKAPDNQAIVQSTSPSAAIAEPSLAEPAAAPKIDMKMAPVTERIAPARTTKAASATIAVTQSSRQDGGALMVVGGAAILVGALIGGQAGDIIAVGGAVAGLIGLYRYLQ